MIARGDMEMDKICVLMLENGQKVLIDVYANEEKGRVRAVALHCETLALESLDYDSSFRSIACMELTEGCLLERKLLMEESYVGTAKLAPEDKFDYETGYLIAVKKLKDKLEKAIASRRRMLAKELRNTAERLEHL